MSDPNDDSSIPVLHEILVQGRPAEARYAPGGAAAPARQPVPDPETTREPMPEHEPALAPEHAYPAEHAHPRKRSRTHHAHAADRQHGHDDEHEPAVAPSAGVFDRAEPHAPIEAGAIVPPDIAHEAPAQPQPNLDADVIAERLRGRFTSFLAGEGRSIVEARCRDALQDHTTWLVNQITREVALALETEMTGWVKEAVDQELARRSGSA
ncbi:DUF2486 family protein [Paraburkholderia agricolaris]|uniref:DUF2486 family protein n=1 Tax=Paraburkholderia agricolaris TaxID=2152888 RepID=UPI0038BB90F5